MRRMNLIGKLLVLALAFLVVGCATTKPPQRPYVPPVVISKDAKPAVSLYLICTPQNLQCYNFRKEILMVYDMSQGILKESYDMRAEGYFLPLVEMDMSRPEPQEWYRTSVTEQRLSGIVTQTPTFVVWEGGRHDGYELARFYGYETSDEFWGQVSEIIRMYRLKDPTKRQRHW